MFKKLKERIKVLENNNNILNKEVSDLKQIIQQMWDETHPPVMGGK